MWTGAGDRRERTIVHGKRTRLEPRTGPSRVPSTQIGLMTVLDHVEWSSPAVLNHLRSTIFARCLAEPPVASSAK